MASDHYEKSLVKEYVDVLREHVITPLNGPVGESCFAAAMLIFAGVDGLGKLIHPDARANVNVRFKAFLPRLGPSYAAAEDNLWALRNSLDHNAMNVACYMSKLDDSKAAHLECDQGHIFVHTRVLLVDFEEAVAKLEADFRSDPALLARAASRLMRGTLNNPSWRAQYLTTPPPGPQFIVS